MALTAFVLFILACVVDDAVLIFMNRDLNISHYGVTSLFICGFFAMLGIILEPAENHPGPPRPRPGT